MCVSGDLLGDVRGVGGGGLCAVRLPWCAPVDPANVPGIIKALRKIAIRNHPDRNSVAKVGENQAAKRR